MELTTEHRTTLISHMTEKQVAKLTLSQLQGIVYEDIYRGLDDKSDAEILDEIINDLEEITTLDNNINGELCVK